MIAHFECFGVRALTDAEQQQLIGGGFWEDVGYWAGRAAAALVNAAEGIVAQLDNYENPKYNGSWSG